MIEDLRYAVRQLRQSPGFSAIAVATLALGVGLAAAMFGLIDGVLLSRPPYTEPDRLVLVKPERLDRTPFLQRPTIGQWLEWRARSRAIEETALYTWSFNYQVLKDGSQSLSGMTVSRNFFRVLGLKPMLGRELTDAEAFTSKTPPTAVIIGHALWQRTFNGDPDIIGKTLTLSRMPAPLPIVGVMPPGVRFLPDPGNSNEPNYDVNATVDFWFAGIPDESRLRDRFNVVGRLRPGATLAQARSEIAAVSADHASREPSLAGLTATVVPVVDELNQDGRRLLVPLFASVALVFLIACGNLAGLLLARGLQRQQEYAVRAALGAGRLRLFRQILTESIALAGAGAVIGGALAAALVSGLKAIGGDAIPRLDAVQVGWPVFGAGVLAALIGSALAGLLPAFRASRPSRVRTVEQTRTSVGRPERRLLKSVAVFQIVLTVALLSGAALLVRTARNLANVRPGYETEHILAMSVTSVQQDNWKNFHVRGLEQVAALPAVTHAAFVWGLPLTGNKWTGDLDIVGQTTGAIESERLTLPLRAVTPDYFDAMGIRLADGRGFRMTDDEKTQPVTIVNESFVRKHLAGASPLGRQLRFSGNPKRLIEIVGVVADTNTEALSAHAEPEVYLPLWQSRAFSKHMIVRTAADPRSVAQLVRRELHSIEPTAAIEHVKTMADIRAESVASRTFAMYLLAGFSAAAITLALVGLYGLLMLSVGSRTKELAVRQAVGARADQIAGLVLGEGFKLVGAGLLVGLVIATLTGRVFAALLYQVEPTDPLTLGASAVVFALVALIACGVPAWRASRVNLIEALRDQ